MHGLCEVCYCSKTVQWWTSKELVEFAGVFLSAEIVP